MQADYIIKSNHIFSGNSKGKFSGIVAIKDEKIVYCGSDHSVIENDAQILDYSEQTVLPGFIDAHAHVYMSVLQYTGEVGVISGTSEEACVQEALAYAKNSLDSEWIVTSGWYLPMWEKQVLPTKESLDKAFPNRAVAMMSGDGHTMWLNSKALEKLGITKESIPPEGGSYEKNANGELTGVLYETAGFKASIEILESKKKNANSAYKKFLDHLAKNGVTGICDVSAMAVEGADQINSEIYKDLLERDELTARIYMFPTITDNLNRPMELRKEYSNSFLQFAGVKQFFDGVSSTHTAYLLEPYSNAYFERDCGKPVIETTRIEKYILSAIENDMNIKLHTIGDKAIHLALDYFEKAEKIYGKKTCLHHSLEHLENIEEQDIRRLAELNIIASMQPGHALIDPEGIERDLGLERTKQMWAYRQMLDNGVTIAFGTDSPIIDTIPLLTIYYAVTRQNVDGLPKGGWEPHQKITLAEALIAHTAGAAASCGRIEDVGTLEAGKLADIIILDKNIFEIDAKELLKTNVIRTIVNGRTIYTTSKN